MRKQLYKDFVHIDHIDLHGPCPDCGAPVQRIRYAENETNYCPRCQTAGRILADRSLSRLLKDDWPRHLDELEPPVTHLLALPAGRRNPARHPRATDRRCRRRPPPPRRPRRRYRDPHRARSHHPFSRAAPLQHVAYSRRSHPTRNARPQAAARLRIPLPPSCQNTARETGPRLCGRARGAVCAWVLLAYAPMQVWQTGPGDEREFLGGETPVERGSG